MTSKMESALNRMKKAGEIAEFSIPEAKPPTTPPTPKTSLKPQSPSPENEIKPPTPPISTKPEPIPDVLSVSEARKYAERKVFELGVPGIPVPKAPPDFALPDDITVVSSEALGAMLGKYTAFSAYLEVEVSKLRVDAHCAEMTLDYNYNKTLLSPEVQTQYDKVGERKSATNITHRIIKLQAQVSKVKAEYETVAALLRAYEKQANVVSREITRRSALLPIMGRST